MDIVARQVSPRVSTVQRRIERAANSFLRWRDAVLKGLHLGGRKAPYNDEGYEFEGGAHDDIRKKHYDKSLRLLWKAEEHAGWSSFRDCSKSEKLLMEMSEKTLSDVERQHLKRVGSREFRELLDRSYTRRQKQAIVNLLLGVGHGEAYAWLVSAELLNDVKSTGARAALTMQVFEEAKHFVVLRELIQAFGVETRRQSAWEYMFMENVFKADGLEKFFGMNVLVEAIALGIFGVMNNFPGLEILHLFHLDESRHTALPVNYFKEFPMSWWQKNSPVSRLRRLYLILPVVPLMMYFEEDFAELGVDVFDFGGSVVKRILKLAGRAGFLLPMHDAGMTSMLNLIFNSYCSLTRSGHDWRDFAAVSHQQAVMGAA